MHQRPWQNLAGGGGGGGGDGGGGGFHPYGYRGQNPSFPFPGNPYYQFQNPSLTQPHFQFQNRTLPQLQFQNPSFPQLQNPSLQIATFPHPNRSQSTPVTLERVEAAVVTAHRNIATAGESVSAWKVSQSALVALNVDSWSSLGFQLQDVPSLHRLIVTEGKVYAFIHCFVGVRRIASLYELEVTICKNESIERFEELGLGPLCRHPLVEHYFSIPSDVTEVSKITSEEIIGFLQKFLDKCKRKITAAEFLDFLAGQKSLPVKEKLGVRIQSLGLLVSYIQEAKKAEDTLLRKSLESIKFYADSNKERHSLQPRGRLLDKEVLDERFRFLSERFKSITSTWDGFGGKHILFDTSDGGDNVDSGDDDDAVGEDHVKKCQLQSSSCDMDGAKFVSSCPYPSSTEEMKRLGLKSGTDEKASRGKGKTMENCGKKSSGKKRKLEEKSSNGGSFGKLLKRDKVIDSEDDQKGLLDLAVTGVDMEKFITTWKEACREHSVIQVLDMMVDFYIAPPKRKKKIRKVFLSYPGIGLLNVAVSSIKCGMLDSLYDTFQDFGERGFVGPDSAPSAEMIQIGPLVKEDTKSNTNEGVYKFPCSVTVDDIIKKISEYFELNNLMPREKELPLEMHFAFLRKFCDCEIWLTAQFSVKEFSSLGHGNFFEFLEKHASLLPRELIYYASRGSYEPSRVEVSMVQQQLGVLLSQAESSLLDNGVVTKHGVSVLLKKQFPTICFQILGNEPEKWFLDLFRGQKESGNSNFVVFSTSLLGKQTNKKLSAYSEKSSSESAVLMNEVGQRACSFESVTLKDAIDCLLKAPMLSDLLSWSHWDIVYAPSFGPLIEWLLNEVQIEELLCIATVNGKLIRIDPSATVDEFLEALVQCSSFQAAVKLLSLLCLYRGRDNAPLSLLKCCVQRAFDVIIRNANDSVEVKLIVDDKMRMAPLQGISDFVQGSNDSPFPVEAQGVSEGICQGNVLHESISRVNEVVTVLSRFILECLGHLPSEFWSFAAELLVSGLRSFAKDAPLVILHECHDNDQRIMLHDIGFALGITEWIEDYHGFSSAAATDTKTPHDVSHPLGLTRDIHQKHGWNITKKMNCSDQRVQFSGVVDVSLKDENHESSAEVNRRKNNHTLASEIHQAYKISKNKDLSEATSEVFDMTENKVQDAIHVIESIRREEFGLDPDLNYAESCLLKKQHARLGRALHCLSQELYSQDSHLLLELVQNADDNNYPESVDPTLVFVLKDTGIIVLNNEQGFSAQNIRALCDIGNSTKKGSSVGYIGRKGIGFKSVFRVTDSPEIHSNGFHVKFDITEGQIGFVLPTVVSPCDIDMIGRLLSGEDYRTDGTSWNTCILLPFRSKVREGTGMSSIISMFSDLHPSLLLFLHRLRCIKFKNMLNDTLIIMRRENLHDGIVKVSYGKETMSWLVIAKKLQDNIIRQDVQTTEIAVAFTLQESDNGEYQPHLSQQPVFSFLPLRNYGLKFILQGDFVLPSSREEVDGDSAWNQWLLSEFPGLFVSAEESFCALPCFQKNPGKAVTAYMSFVPLVGEVYGFFSHLPHMIISRLRMSRCLLLDSPDVKWVLPCRVLRGWDEQARKLLSESLLQKHLGLGFLSKDVVLSDSLARSLGIQEYGPKVLIEIISSICQSNDGVSPLGLDWLVSWLAVLYSTLSALSTGYNSMNSGLVNDLICNLTKIPFIPLSDGSYGAVSDGPIWLPCDVLNIGIEGKVCAEDFPILYAKLRTVNPLLFSAAAANTYIMEEMRVDNLIKMLCKVGVQQLSAHEVIKSHILVVLSDDKNLDKDRSLMIEYLSFIMLHFQYTCASCHSEKADIISELRTRTVLLTSHGFRCLLGEPIHFGKEYVNPFDVVKVTDDVDFNWLEVDVAYLKHPSTQSLSFGSMKWREFFLELGVTDFVQVNCIRKRVPDVQSTDLGNAMCKGDRIVTASLYCDWESPELVNMLSTVSSNKLREKCILILEILDKMWDNYYSPKARINFISKTINDEKHFESSFMKSIREIRWIASSVDQELHYAKDLFYDCEEVRSVLGAMVPYAVPQVTSKLLLKDIGFKTKVLLDDALMILHSWSMSKAPFVASTLQMSKFYRVILEGVATSRVKITEFISSSFIFIPFASTSAGSDVVSGMFLSPKEVYWHDPTGCVGITMEMILQYTRNMSDCVPCKALATVYPSLHDFFVNMCCVNNDPPFGSYLQILLQLSKVALPSQAAHSVFRVFLKWADDLKSGSVKSEEIIDLKENLLKLENTVLPTLQDKWVSLHPSFGLICWSDDEELKQEFKNSDDVDFVWFGELSNEEKEMLHEKVSMLMQKIGVPALSEVVSREAIFYGTGANEEKTFLINWVLPFAQRYLHKLYLNLYLCLKQTGFEKISQLCVVVVDKLYYKHTLKGHSSTNTSNKHFECCSLLQGNILYATMTADSHSMFLELSRFFFSGSAELHFANFLHMITTMAESGSTNEQIEFFVVNSQKVPKLPDEEPVWSLSSLSGHQEDESTQPVCPSPVIEQNNSISHRKPGIIANWPPTDWKTAPGFTYSSVPSVLWTRSGPAPSKTKSSMGDRGKPVEAVNQDKDLPVSVEVDGDWIIEEGIASSRTQLLQDSVMLQPHLVESFETIDGQADSSSKDKSKPADSAEDPWPHMFPIDLSASPERDSLCVPKPDENQARKNGRLGEMLAYKYFAEKLGPGSVDWVNKETETGLPYDLIIQEKEEDREYVEVKATKSVSKNWFQISMREWQFAAEKGASFSIAHVLLLGPSKASIMVLKDPYKLCQQNALKLAVLMSKQVRDPPVTT